jgi:uncharacterized protein with FMN-binding domain
MKPLRIILSLLVIVFLGGFFFLSLGLNKGKTLVVNDVDLSLLKDGTYTGKYNEGRWSNEVNATVKNHKIIKIEVIKDVLFPRTDVTEELVKRIIESQSIGVDAISGATVTCKAYLKSIEDALK